ncbi:1,4-dihydroxy-2-naphthoate octaprenyltransferase [uncultured Thiohalocapsa sp.]|uniref:1,4-dihydroxy-2-naphthoate octaprenyltransferase n=1 Tax=uncultured Thiohalocapsa sp. TaxID=768990 RepID=UPI0025F7480E|nr:1,4-dihydroxy-2-naphthoate octaprenyltransferase [uncultured Thiohalocapsa sp.]
MSKSAALTWDAVRQHAGRWLSAARPKTLPLAVTPVLGALLLALADTGRIAPLTALATLLAAAGIQIGTNLHNDAADYERGTDTGERLGPPRASAQGWFTSAQVKRAAHIAFLTSFILGLLLVLRGGWPILLLGLAAIAAGYAYTGGPKPIAYGPYGELYVLGFFGIAAVAGSYYLQTLTLSAGAISLGLALGLPAAAVLLLNNYRDFDTDRAAGRHTLCHLLGRRTARLVYAGLLLAPVPLMLWGGLPGTTWPVLAALPAAAWLIRQLHTRRGQALNALLARTAQYQMLLVGLYGLGLFLGWLRH